MSIEQTQKQIDSFTAQKYKYGFETIIDSDRPKKGINEDIISYISLKKINWLDESISKINLKCSAKIRSTQKENPGTLNINTKKSEFIFDEEINTTSPGQACVFYLKDQVLGGGWITNTRN